MFIVVEQPVAELDGVHLLEPVLRDPASRLGVPHPEHVLVARRPAAAIRRAVRRPPHGGGGGDVDVHRSRVDAVASPVDEAGQDAAYIRHCWSHSYTGGISSKKRKIWSLIFRFEIGRAHV